jgi:hypothetical protein
MNVIRLPQRHRPAGAPPAAHQPPLCGASLYELIAADCSYALAQNLGTFDEIALRYLDLVGSLPESHERDALLVDIAMARHAIHTISVALNTGTSGRVGVCARDG